MEYTIDTIYSLQRGGGWRFQVTLWVKKKVAYVGHNTYSTLIGAQRAARAAGAKPRSTDK
jgi:hypothetical protein